MNQRHRQSEPIAMITKLRVAGGDDGEPDGAEEEDDELLGDLGQ